MLQSHVERQGHASGDWELDNASSSSPSLIEQYHGQENGGDRALDFSDDADRDLFAPNSFNASQPLWEEEQGTIMPHINLNQHFGTVISSFLGLLNFLIFFSFSFLHWLYEEFLRHSMLRRIILSKNIL